MGVQVDSIRKLDLGTDNYQLHRVMPAQLSPFWPRVKEAIARSLPHSATVDELVLSSIMRKIMLSEMVLWVLLRVEKEEEPRIAMVLLLAFTSQLGMEEYKNLFIYALAGLEPHTPETVWERVYKALLEYGRMTGCKKLCGVTKDPQLLALYQRLQPGLDVEMRDLSFNLEG